MFLNQLAMEPTTFEFFKYLRNRNVRDVKIGGGDFGSCCFDDFGLLFGLDALTLFADCVVVVFSYSPDRRIYSWGGFDHIYSRP